MAKHSKVVVRSAGADVDGQIFNTLSHDGMTYAFGEKRNKTTSFPLRHTLLIYTFPSRSSDQTRKRKGRSLFIPPKYKKISLPSYPIELCGHRTDGRRDRVGRRGFRFVGAAGGAKTSWKEVVGIDGRQDDGWEPWRSRKTKSVDKLTVRYSDSLLVGESIRRLSAAEPKRHGVVRKKISLLVLPGGQDLASASFETGNVLLFLLCGLENLQMGLRLATAQWSRSLPRE